MTEEELAAFATWLRQTQGVNMEPADLRGPADAVDFGRGIPPEVGEPDRRFLGV